MARVEWAWMHWASTLQRKGKGLGKWALSAFPLAQRRARRWTERLLGRTTVTLALEGDSARVVVFKGSAVVRWGAVHLGKQEHALRTLLRGMGVRKGRIVSALPLCNALARRVALPRVPRHLLPQAALAEAQEVFPFAPGEADLAWRPMRNGAGESILAVAVPKEAIDSHIQSLQSEGVHPTAVYPKEVALAALVGQGLVVYLGEQDTAVLAVLEGIPRVVYRVPLPQEPPEAQRQALLIADAIEQAQAYVRGNNGGKGSQPLPVILVGDPEREAWLAPALQNLLDKRPQPVAVPLSHPPHFPASAYAVNLGLAIAHGIGAPGYWGKAGLFPAPNVLPRRHRPRPFPLVLGVGLLALPLLGLLAVWGTGQVARRGEEVSRLSARLEHIQASQRLQRLTAAQAANLERQAKGLEQMATAAQSHLGTLRQEREALLARIEAITQGAQEAGVKVSGVSLQADAFSLGGTAPTYEAAIRYATGLRLSGLFADVRLLRMDAAGGGGEQGMVSFQIKALVGNTPGHK